MKTFWLWTLGLVIFGWTAVRLADRWRDERNDRTVAILVDWYEVRGFAARLKLPPQVLLKQLKTAGATGLLLGEATLEDYIVRPWENPLRDTDAGFDLRLVKRIREVGLPVVLRVNADPWVDPQIPLVEIQQILALIPNTAVLFSSDETPGGLESIGYWKTLVAEKGLDQLLFEFRPTRAALRLAQSLPAQTYRAHTIQTAELKDLTEDQEMARWTRAVEERSCRFLLLHVSTDEDLTRFLDRVSRLENVLSEKGWTMGWPLPRAGWNPSSFLQRRLAPFIAFLLATLVPLAALRLTLTWKTDHGVLAHFLFLTACTLLGAVLLAAIAQSPETRLQVIPFRGVKLAFLLSWMGSFLILYSKGEIRNFLVQNIRRLDVIISLGVLTVLVYLLARTGNAGPGWKAGGEQLLRDRLEEILIARPRFKEFALGHPLMLLGFYLWQRRKRRDFWNDGRLWIAVGMLGQISIVNTFCHLHSPLALAFGRTANGLLLGSLFGGLLILLYAPLEHQISRVLRR